MKLLLLSLALTISQASPGQTASTRPADATGICKDGSFTSAPQRAGACQGHKGVQTWYNTGTPALPPPTPAALPALPAPSVVPANTNSLPAPTPAASPSLPAAAIASSPSLPTPKPAALPTEPAPHLTPTTPSLPPPQPGHVDTRSSIANERSRILAAAPAPGGGPGLVWLNTGTKVYHCPGSDYYGKTKNGVYTSESDAKAQGGHPNRNKPCS